MKLKTCICCNELFLVCENECPHCEFTTEDFEIQKERSITSSSTKLFSRSALLLGLALTGCGDKTEDTATDTASEPTVEPTSEPAVEPPYGVPDTGDTNEDESEDT